MLRIAVFLFGYGGSWFTVIRGLAWISAYVEDLLSRENKAAVARLLKSLDWASAASQVPVTFAGVFDTVFGEQHLSWKCFSRSCIASLVAVLAVSLLWVGLRPGEFLEIISGGQVLLGSAIILVGALILNLLPDYLSLLETRYVIGAIHPQSSATRVLVFVVIDAVVTAVIMLVAYMLFGLIKGGQILEGETCMLFPCTYDPILWWEIPELLAEILPLTYIPGIVSQPPLGVWF